MDFVLRFNYSEKEFIDACVRNERWAQKRLYEEHYSQMMGVCLRYARNEHDALDILQEGFIKVFRNITKYQPGTTLAAWIRRIMVNTAIDYYRKNIRRRTEDLDTAYELKSMDADAISQCSEKEILEAVQQLTPAYRVVFNLYVIEGYSHKEIAELMEITESTSRSNLVKSRMKLRAIINKKL